MYYERVFRSLEEKGVRYAVAGGVALVLHGVVRFTADLDLLVDLDRKNLECFLSVMRELGYRPRNPVDAEDLLDPAKRQAWKRDKNMQIFSFVDPAKPMSLVDVFLEEPLPFPEISAGIVRMTAKGTTIPVVSVEHLKRLKRLAGRPQDLADIEAIESLEQERP
jgi:hypothetical protein